MSSLAEPKRERRASAAAANPPVEPIFTKYTADGTVTDNYVLGDLIGKYAINAYIDFLLT